MKARSLFIFVIVLAGEVIAKAFQTEQTNAARPTFESLMKGLSEKSGEELRTFIDFLGYELPKEHLPDEEIDRIVEKLLVIQRTDPFQRTEYPKGGQRMAYANREASERCVGRLRFQKIANRLRRMPMEQRVAETVAGMIDPPMLGYETTGAFAKELVAAGKDAVPYIIQHQPEQSYSRQWIVRALAEIGDARGIDYIIEVLRTEGDAFQSTRPEAARMLGRFRGKKVVSALIEALNDQTYLEVDRHQPPGLIPGHKPYLGTYYSVQHAAAQSLSTITGKDWGLLSNEDYKTWRAWLMNGDGRDAFSPRSVPRTEEEVAQLIRSLYHRYMSARPNPWQPQNIFSEEVGLGALVGELKALGETIVPVIERECRARVAERPIWKGELTEWTRQLLERLEWDDAVAAAHRIGE